MPLVLTSSTLWKTINEQVLLFDLSFIRFMVLQLHLLNNSIHTRVRGADDTEIVGWWELVFFRKENLITDLNMMISFEPLKLIDQVRDARYQPVFEPTFEPLFVSSTIVPASLETSKIPIGLLSLFLPRLNRFGVIKFRFSTSCDMWRTAEVRSLTLRMWDLCQNVQLKYREMASVVW